MNEPSTFRDPRTRLLACWALVTLGLSHHEWFFSPRQPIHFARGYAWSATFLIGFPALRSLLDHRGRWARAGAILLVFAMLSDNALWLARFVAEAREPGRNGLRLTSESLEVLRWIDRPESLGVMVVSEDEPLGYLALAETPARSWLGHHLETPDYAFRKAQSERFFRDGTIPDEWIGRALWIIRYRDRTHLPAPPIDRFGPPVFESRKFQVFRVTWPDRPGG